MAPAGENGERTRDRRKLRTLGPAGRGDRAPGREGLLRRAGGRLFRTQGRDVDPAARTGRLDLLACGGPAAVGRQAACDPPERLDDDGRGDRLSRPELPEQAAHCENRTQPISAAARPRPCPCRRGGPNDRRGRNLPNLPPDTRFRVSFAAAGNLLAATGRSIASALSTI